MVERLQQQADRHRADAEEATALSLELKTRLQVAEAALAEVTLQQQKDAQEVERAQQQLHSSLGEHRQRTAELEGQLQRCREEMASDRQQAQVQRRMEVAAAAAAAEEAGHQASRLRQQLSDIQQALDGFQPPSLESVAGPDSQPSCAERVAALLACEARARAEAGKWKEAAVKAAKVAERTVGRVSDMEQQLQDMRSAAAAGASEASAEQTGLRATLAALDEAVVEPLRAWAGQSGRLGEAAVAAAAQSCAESSCKRMRRTEPLPEPSCWRLGSHEQGQRGAACALVGWLGRALDAALKDAREGGSAAASSELQLRELGSKLQEEQEGKLQLQRQLERLQLDRSREQQTSESQHELHQRLAQLQTDLEAVRQGRRRDLAELQQRLAQANLQAVSDSFARGRNAAQQAAKHVLQDLQHRIAGLEEEVSAQRNAAARSAAEARAAQQQLADASRRACAAETEAADAQSKAAQLQSELQAACASQEAARRSLEDAQVQRVAQDAAGDAKLQEQAASLAEAVQEAAALQQEAAQLRRSQALAEQQAVARQGELQEAQRQLAEAQAEKQEAFRREEQQRTAAEDLALTLRERSSALQRQEEEQLAAKAKAERLSAQLQAADAEAAELRAALDARRAAAAAAEAAAGEARQAAAELERELKTCRMQLSCAQQTLADVRAAHVSEMEEAERAAAVQVSEARCAAQLEIQEASRKLGLLRQRQVRVRSLIMSATSLSHTLPPSAVAAATATAPTGPGCPLGSIGPPMPSSLDFGAPL